MPGMLTAVKGVATKSMYPCHRVEGTAVDCTSIKLENILILLNFVECWIN